MSDLRQDVAGVVKRVLTSDRPLVITQRGRAVAVTLSVNSYERAEQERQLLRLLAQGGLEIAQGVGHDLDQVLSDADALLADARE